jgi:hypothetical protein
MALPRCCALTLVLAVLAPGFGPLLAFGAGAEHVCADHVCACARRCPPKRSTGSGCHAKEDGRSDCSMRGACRHDQAAATTVATPLSLAPESLVVESTFAAEPVVRAPLAPAPVGFSRIDPRPPRTL